MVASSSNKKLGLSSAEAKSRLKKYGFNIISDKEESFLNYIDEGDKLGSIITHIDNYRQSPDHYIDKAHNASIHIRNNFSTEKIANRYYNFYLHQVSQLN